MRNPNERKISVDVFGDFALFTRPDNKVERVSYPVMTPSAARGILNAIYSKPLEFYYEIDSIEVMNPIKWISIKKNEVKGKIQSKTLDPLYVDTTGPEGKSKGRTQRNNMMLRNVYYRINARIIKHPDYTLTASHNMDGILAQFNKRVRRGQCFYQPCFGTRECMAYFAPPDESRKALEDINLDIGTMLYDVFDIRSNTPLVTGGKHDNSDDVVHVSFFDAKVESGVLKVPPYDSEFVRRV